MKDINNIALLQQIKIKPFYVGLSGKLNCIVAIYQPISCKMVIIRITYHIKSYIISFKSNINALSRYIYVVA